MSIQQLQYHSIFFPVSQQELYGDPGSICPARHYAGFDDGCIRLRLEWGSPSVPSQWCLVTMGTFQLIKLEGVESNFGFSHSLQEVSSRTLHQSPFRQQGGFVLYLQSVLFTHSSIIRPFQRIIAIHSVTKYFFGPCSHQGCIECPCGQRIKF